MILKVRRAVLRKEDEGRETLEKRESQTAIILEMMVILSGRRGVAKF